MSRVHVGLAAAALILALAAAGQDLRSAAEVTELAFAIEAAGDYISAPDLAERIVRGDTGLRVFDLRSRGDYEQFHVASASHITLEALARTALPADATIVLYSDGVLNAARGWRLLRARGQARVVVLREGLYEWIGRVVEPRLASDATAAERAQFIRAAETSRFFGGLPLASVPRADVPVGYWTGVHRNRQEPAAVSRRAIASIRRRGC